ncbi:Nramp family divalent metal transporter [Haladaptatus halobius]|uniref:Nramp family divalent metal transporter n=1 Tax=Haladaptatus halobius TaxID=2884875 RepID=UPI001D0A80E0|nr:Nramp family divalent metal transporter [Haladaptatus halobius]
MTDTDDTRSSETRTESDGGVARGDIYASEEQGKAYRDSVYNEVDYESLEEAPEMGSYPKKDDKGGFRLVDMPKAPKVNHIVGPSAIMLGAALGSGETMFWPAIIANEGWALYWAFWVGVLTQFFINTELQRWSMATGESIFRGFDRLSRFWPWFFLVAGLLQLGWPGWAASGGQVFAAWTGVVPESQWWVIGLATMVIIWLSYQAGPVMYNVIEKAQLAMMFIAIGGAIVLIFLVDSTGQLARIPAGAVSFGTLPDDVGIATFLGGLAYAGAGGYVNLSQGVWSREKGYGVGSYQGRVKNPLRGDAEPEEVHGGLAFEPTETNLKRWRAWWKVSQQEHFLTFVIGLLIIATVAMTIAAKYVPANQTVSTDAVAMWIDVIIPQLGGANAFLMYLVVFIALFSTQYAIVEAFTRNSVDIIYQVYGRQHGMDVSRVFLGALTVFVLWGMAIIGANAITQITTPWVFLVIGAAMAGVMMWPYNALTIILNTTRMPEHTQPGWGRVFAMWWATGFFGFFSVLLIGDVLSSRLGLSAFSTEVAIMGSGVGGYVLWLLALVVQVYTMYRSARAKLDANDTVEGAEEASGFLA